MRRSRRWRGGGRGGRGRGRFAWASVFSDALTVGRRERGMMTDEAVTSNDDNGWDAPSVCSDIMIHMHAV